MLRMIGRLDPVYEIAELTPEIACLAEPEHTPSGKYPSPGGFKIRTLIHMLHAPPVKNVEVPL
jgi:hypothetical protein